MKKSLLILSAVAANCLFANSVILDEITITTATKTEKNIAGVNASVEVITSEEIEKLGAESLKEVLSKASSINVEYGTFPSASSISKGSITIRGMGSKGTLFLVDGRRLSGEVSNPYDIDRIPASSIERIEIVKGPMSTLYGADAAGGVINIITKKPTEEIEINFGARYGQNEDGDDQNTNINFDARGKVNDFSYSFYLNQTSTTPYTQKETADVWARNPAFVMNPMGGAPALVRPSSITVMGGNRPLAMLQNSYDVDVTYKEKSDILTLGGRTEYNFTDNITAGLEFNYFNEEREGTYIAFFHPANVGAGLPIFNAPVDSVDENERIDISTDLNVIASDDLTLNFRLYRSYYEKRNETSAVYWRQMGYSSKEASQQTGLTANVEVISFETVANYALNEEHLLTGGFEIRDESREGTVFTRANILTERKVDYKALYLQDEWQLLEDLNIILGARYDDISNTDSEATFKIGAVKNFSKAFNARINFAQGYRVPDIRELYINKATPTGLNQGAAVVGFDLKPEFTNSFEIGVNGVLDNSRYDVAIFHNDIKDRITAVRRGAGTAAFTTFENISEAETYGLEFNFRQYFNEQFSANFNWIELQTEDKQTKKELEFNPERVISLNLNYDLSNNFSTSLGAKYISSQYYVETLNQGAPTQSFVDAQTGDYTLINAIVHYTLNKSVSFYLGIDNIADEKVDDDLGSNSGRYFFTGVKISL